MSFPIFTHDAGVSLIEIGSKEFMCVGANPPFDHPHVSLDLGNDKRDHLPLLLDGFIATPADPRRRRSPPARMRGEGQGPPDRAWPLRAPSSSLVPGSED